MALPEGTILSLVAGLLALQAPCPAPLLSPAHASSHDFTRVIAAAYLTGDSALIVDAADDRIYLVAPKERVVVQWLREGQGPAEYSRPRFIKRLAADRVAVFSEGTRRLTVHNPRGTVVRSLTLPNVAGYLLRGFANDSVLFMEDFWPMSLPPRLSGLNAGSRSLHPTTRDSIPILRRRVAGEQFDTLTRVALPVRRTTIGSAVTTSPGYNDIYQPFGERDDWAVSPSGLVAVVRGTSYVVEWYGLVGGRSGTTVLTAAKVPVTQAEKDAWWSRSRHDSIIDLDCRSEPCRPVGVHKAAMPTDWPPLKNPFDYQSLVFAPDSALWIRRAAPVDADYTCYDVVRPRRSPRQVRLPGNRKVLAVGGGWIFAVAQDEDDLQFIELYAHP